MDTPKLTAEQRRALTAPAREAAQRKALQKRLDKARELLEGHGYTVTGPETREPETRDASGESRPEDDRR